MNKIKKIETYKNILRNFKKGIYGKTPLPIICIENGVDYQQVIKYKTVVDNEKE